MGSTAFAATTAIANLVVIIGIIRTDTHLKKSTPEQLAAVDAFKETKNYNELVASMAAEAA